MAIPEDKFEDWNSTGADEGSKAARNTIYNALRSERSPLEQKGNDYDPFLQGSYAESTHTRGSSDVDVVVKLTSAWQRDLTELSPAERERYEDSVNDDPDYVYDEFRGDVYTALKTKFGAGSVHWSSKAIKISSDDVSSLDVDVDIVPCQEYRVYHAFPEGNVEPDFTSGMFFRPRFGSQKIINFPKIHKENGNDKNKYRNTKGRYKETIRIFKNARHYINKQRLFGSLDAPSYYITCLLYNLDDDLFESYSRSDRFIGIVEELEETDIDGFGQQSKMLDLFGDEPTQWSVREAEIFIAEMRDLWEDNPF